MNMSCLLQIKQQRQLLSFEYSDLHCSIAIITVRHRVGSPGLPSA